MMDGLQEARGRLRRLQHDARVMIPEERQRQRVGVEKDLTVIVSTSVIPSVPETALLEACFNGLALTPQLMDCRKIIVCDGIAGTTQGRANYKKSMVSEELIAQYAEYIDRVKALSSTGAFSNTEVVVLPEHYGFGLGLLHALKMVTTEFVLIVQHDQVFLRGFKIADVIAAMRASPEVLKYVGLASRSSMGYEERVKQRFGVQISPMHFPPLDTTLLPLLMWYDKPHVCQRDHYLNFVFNPERFSIKTGQFPEDVLGQQLIDSVKSSGLSAHGEYGTWVMNEATPLTYHLSGRKVKVASGQDKAGGTQGEGQSLGIQDQDWHTHCTSFTMNVSGLTALDHEATNELPSRFKGTCFRCRKKGHSFKYCPELRGDVQTKSIATGK